MHSFYLFTSVQAAVTAVSTAAASVAATAAPLQIGKRSQASKSHRDRYILITKCDDLSHSSLALAALACFSTGYFSN